MLGFVLCQMSRWRYLWERLGYWPRLFDLRYERLRRLFQAKHYRGRVADLCFAILDLLGVCDLYEALGNTVFPSVRSLTEAEIRMLRPIFADSVPYHLIRVDERSWIGPRFANFCYVGFHTINSWGPMSPPVLVHEVVHVWQYTHCGAAYIPRALRAQRSLMGYNYGGLEPLASSNSLGDFNYEQQADIIEDAFRLTNGWQPQWVRGRGAEILPYYYPYLAEIRTAKMPRIR